MPKRLRVLGLAVVRRPRDGALLVGLHDLDEEFIVTEGAVTQLARWVQPAELAARRVPLYPDGIVDLIAHTVGEVAT